jgi:hypothetical protein
LYAEVKHPNETAAIKWLDQRVTGTPTIVTAPGGRWEWRSAPAALTGIPTVAGWAHELVYRDSKKYYSRVHDVRVIFKGSPSRRIELLKQYDVEYIYVGPEERQRYDVWEFSILDGVSVAYRNRETTIYRVNQLKLDYSVDPVTTIQYSATAFDHNNPVATHRNGRIVAAGTSTNRSLAWLGPYVALPPGAYVAKFQLTVNATSEGSESASKSVAVVDVARGASPNGTADYRILGDVPVSRTDGIRTVTVPFTLTQPALDMEFRGWVVSKTGTVTLHNVTVERVPVNETENES